MFEANILIIFYIGKVKCGLVYFSKVELMLSELPTLNELLEAKDYYQFFNNKYGVGSLNTDEVLITKRITTFFDAMFEGVTNRDYIMRDINAYLQTGDVAELHSKLFN